MLDDDLTEDFSSTYPIKGKIDLIDEKAMFNFQDEESKNHLAFMNADGDKIYCYLKVFNVFEAIVKISNDAKKYPDFKGNFISINPLSGVIKESSYLEAILRFRQ